MFNFLQKTSKPDAFPCGKRFFLGFFFIVLLAPAKVIIHHRKFFLPPLQKWQIIWQTLNKRRCLKYRQKHQKIPPLVGAEQRIGTPHARSCKRSMCFHVHLCLIIKTRCFSSTLFMCVCVIMTHTGTYVRSSALTKTCVYLLQMWGFKRV